MKNNLIQTSSIFSKARDAELEDEQVLVEEEVELVPDEEELVKYCKVIEFKGSLPEANITLEKFFPDSMFCVLHNKHSNAYFAGHMKEELIFEVPFKDYSVILVTSEMIVLQVNIEFEDEDAEPVYMILRNGEYTLELDYKIKKISSEIEYEGKEYSMLTTEIQPPEYSADNSTVTYHYQDGKIIHASELFVIFEGNKGEHLMLADCGGSYIGYYLPLNMDGTANLHGRHCDLLQRLTLTLVVVEDVETQERFFLTCANQMLVSVDDFHQGDVTDIPVMNGVAMLIEQDTSGLILNVFTPNHQRIVLEPKYKIDYKSFGNGLYFPKDNVLLLDNGSLTFTQPVSSDVISVRGREVPIPIKHLGDL